MSKKGKKTSSAEMPESVKESRDTAQLTAQVHHIEGQFREVQTLHNKIDQALSTISDDHPEIVELKRTLKFNFPDVLHARYQDLSPGQKLWAVAEVEGWSKNAFSDKTGISRTSLQQWSKRADVLLFQRDYKTAQNIGDPGQAYAQMAHKALRYYDEVLQEKPYSLEEKQFKFKVASYVTDKIHKDIVRDANKEVDFKELSEILKKPQEAAPPVEELFEGDDD